MVPVSLDHAKARFHPLPLRLMFAFKVYLWFQEIANVFQLVSQGRLVVCLMVEQTGQRFLTTGSAGQNDWDGRPTCRSTRQANDDVDLEGEKDT